MNQAITSKDSTAKLSLHHICHRFDGAADAIFDGLNLSVQAGQVVAIVGASGVGKSTLFQIVAGLLAPDAGQVLIDGVDVTGQAGRVGYMRQKDLLLPFKSVYENITLPLMLKGIAADSIRQKLAPLLPIFGLEMLTAQYPQQLSGGQRQRAALLRTYLSNDHLMLLDEPFSALDFVMKEEMYAWFSQFQQKLGLTCLRITHDIDEALTLADEIYVLAQTATSAPADFNYHAVVPKTAGFRQTLDYLTMKNAIMQAVRGK